MKKTVCIIMSMILIFFAFSLTAFSADKNSEDQVRDSLPPDGVKACSAVLAEVTTGKILIEYNADVKRSPASITKIMTVLLVCEALDSGKITLADKVVCSSNAASKGGSQIWLEKGETMTVDELLKASVIGSANDAATLLGEYISGSEESFIAAMNERAHQLGMKNTHFENATGLDDTTDTHLSTARDIAIMSCELLKHDIIKNYSTVWMDSLRNGKTELVNTNKLVRFYDGTTGLKTGTTTKAGCCISASAERNGLHLVAVVLGSENSNDRFESAKALLNRGFKEYTMFTPEADESLVTDINVIGGEYPTVSPVIPEMQPVIIKKGDETRVKQKITLPVDLEAPVISGQTVGTVVFTLDGSNLTEYKLKADRDIEKMTYLKALKRFLCFIITAKTEIS